MIIPLLGAKPSPISVHEPRTQVGISSL